MDTNVEKNVPTFGLLSSYRPVCLSVKQARFIAMGAIGRMWTFFQLVTNFVTPDRTKFRSDPIDGLATRGRNMKI
jgi:hypothetical protein